MLEAPDGLQLGQVRAEIADTSVRFAVGYTVWTGPCAWRLTHLTAYVHGKEWELHPLTPCCGARAILGGYQSLECRADPSHKFKHETHAFLPIGMAPDRMAREAKSGMLWWLEEVWAMDPLASELAVASFEAWPDSVDEKSSHYFLRAPS